MQQRSGLLNIVYSPESMRDFLNNLPSCAPDIASQIFEKMFDVLNECLFDHSYNTPEPLKKLNDFLTQQKQTLTTEQFAELTDAVYYFINGRCDVFFPGQYSKNTFLEITVTRNGDFLNQVNACLDSHRPSVSLVSAAKNTVAASASAIYSALDAVRSNGWLSAFVFLLSIKHLHANQFSTLNTEKRSAELEQQGTVLLEKDVAEFIQKYAYPFDSTSTQQAAAPLVHEKKVSVSHETVSEAELVIRDRIQLYQKFIREVRSGKFYAEFNPSTENEKFRKVFHEMSHASKIKHAKQLFELSETVSGEVIRNKNNNNVRHQDSLNKIKQLLGADRTVLMSADFQSTLSTDEGIEIFGEITVLANYISGFNADLKRLLINKNSTALDDFFQKTEEHISNHFKRFSEIYVPSYRSEEARYFAKIIYESFKELWKTLNNSDYNNKHVQSARDLFNKFVSVLKKWQDTFSPKEQTEIFGNDIYVAMSDDNSDYDTLTKLGWLGSMVIVLVAGITGLFVGDRKKPKPNIPSLSEREKESVKNKTHLTAAEMKHDDKQPALVQPGLFARLLDYFWRKKEKPAAKEQIKPAFNAENKETIKEKGEEKEKHDDKQLSVKFEADLLNYFWGVLGGVECIAITKEDEITLNLSIRKRQSITAKEQKIKIAQHLVVSVETLWDKLLEKLEDYLLTSIVDNQQLTITIKNPVEFEKNNRLEIAWQNICNELKRKATSVKQKDDQSDDEQTYVEESILPRAALAHPVPQLKPKSTATSTASVTRVLQPPPVKSINRYRAHAKWLNRAIENLVCLAVFQSEPPLNLDDDLSSIIKKYALLYYISSVVEALDQFSRSMHSTVVSLEDGREITLVRNLILKLIVTPEEKDIEETAKNLCEGLSQVLLSLNKPYLKNVALLYRDERQYLLDSLSTEQTAALITTENNFIASHNSLSFVPVFDNMPIMQRYRQLHQKFETGQSEVKVEWNHIFQAELLPKIVQLHDYLTDKRLLVDAEFVEVHFHALNALRMLCSCVGMINASIIADKRYESFVTSCRADRNDLAHKKNNLTPELAGKLLEKCATVVQLSSQLDEDAPEARRDHRRHVNK